MIYFIFINFLFNLFQLLTVRATAQLKPTLGGLKKRATFRLSDSEIAATQTSDLAPKSRQTILDLLSILKVHIFNLHKLESYPDPKYSKLSKHRNKILAQNF